MKRLVTTTLLALLFAGTLIATGCRTTVAVPRPGVKVKVHKRVVHPHVHVHTRHCRH